MRVKKEMTAYVAGELERGDGLPCGGCGRMHAVSADSWEEVGPLLTWDGATSAFSWDADWERPCDCPCCVRYFREWCKTLHDEFPGIFDHNGNIDGPALDRELRRLAREAGAEHVLQEAGLWTQQPGTDRRL